MEDVKLTFQRKDWNHPTDSIAEEVANLVFYGDSSMYRNLITVLQTTGFYDYKAKGYKLCDMLSHQAVNRNQKLLYDKLREALGFEKDHWRKFRGTVAEKLIEPQFKKNHSSEERHYGAAIYINDKKVHYKPNHPSLSRQTVDAIAWNGQRGVFAEIKFSPESYDQSTMGFLDLLSDSLVAVTITHEIQLIHFLEETTMEMILSERRNRSNIGTFNSYLALEYIQKS